MTTKPMHAAIEDARALLDALVASGWNDMHVVSGATEIFVAKPSGRANPLRAPAQPAAIAEPERQGAREEVRAPHVATLTEVTAIGTRIAAGDQIALLRVLEEVEPLVASSAGVVVAHPAAIGALLDFGAPVAILELAA